jgi:precorrin-2 dehydrogenase/sirohydrochlorin ferrochelatase
MLPLIVDVRRLRVVLIGEGEAARRRLERLDEAGAEDVAVHAATPSPALARAAGKRLLRRSPTAQELAAARLVFISENTAANRALVHAAQAAGALVHVEDAPALSDVQVPALVRRGELTIAVSTGGKSPALAAQLRRFLARVFGPEWHGRVEALALLRLAWRAAGADAATVARRTEGWIDSQGWLPTETGRSPGAPSVHEPYTAAVTRH